VCFEVIEELSRRMGITFLTSILPVNQGPPSLYLRGSNGHTAKIGLCCGCIYHSKAIEKNSQVIVIFFKDIMIAFVGNEK
jgi:hypothetical protein